ncbi:MAG: HAD-IC family P-type ATPase, partial [Legionella sp.]
MTTSLIFQESFLISGIMCFDGCGNTLQNMLKNSINDRITQKILPADAKLIVDAEPAGLGIHRLTISIESESKQFAPSKDFDSALYDQIKKDISFDIIDEQTDINIQSNARKNWLNILVNVLSMTTVLTLTVLFPPSLLLTIGLTALTFLSATFTSREYLWTFIQNLRTKNVATMATTISLGWLLSMAHTLFH